MMVRFTDISKNDSKRLISVLYGTSTVQVPEDNFKGYLPMNYQKLCNLCQNYRYVRTYIFDS